MTHVRPSVRYRVGILIGALVIIGLGVALRPKEKTPQNPISELENARLQRLAQERRLQELGEYISYAAQTAAKGLVYLPELEQTAVIVDGHTVATIPRRAVKPPVKALSGAGGEFELSSPLRRPDVPVLLLRPAGLPELDAPPHVAADTGDWVVAVALREDASPVFAYGLYESSVQARCGSLTYTRLRASIPLTNVFVGGGLFSLRGLLAGVIARCGDEIVVLSVNSVSKVLNTPVPPNDWLQDRYGLRVDAGSAGLQVVSVWQKSPAAGAKLSPGDLILRVDGSQPAGAAELLAALDSEGSHDITLRRGDRTLRTRMMLASTPQEAPASAAGMVLVDSPQGVLVRSVADGGLAARAGVLPGDLVRRLGGLAAPSADLAVRALNQDGQPVSVTVERNGSLFEARLAP
jgi:S1-C subfamily serine protease